MADAINDAPQAKPWGYLATIAWAFVAFFVGQVAAFVALLLWQHGDIGAVRQNPFDGASITLQVFVLNPVTVAILVLAVRLKGADIVDYLALIWPRWRDITIGIVGIALIIVATDAFLFLSGRAIVSQFQVESYITAGPEGWLVPLWLATILVAPAGEEVLFRGFLFRGFIRSPRAAWPGIVVISALWALPHVQYDWTGVLEIFIAGLFLGWVRWRGGSVLLTFLLHGLFNLEGMMETVIQVKYFM